jgi:hypothetical protein
MKMAFFHATLFLLAMAIAIEAKLVTSDRSWQLGNGVGNKQAASGNFLLIH